MKRAMPSTDHIKQVERYYPTQLMRNSENQAASHHASISKRNRPQKRRKHNDSISESKLIKEKLPSSSLATIGKSINVLIPRNNHNILETIDLTATDGAVLKQLMNNNNGDLNLNGGGGFDEEDNDDDIAGGDDSDSETVTGDESVYEQEEDDEESDSEDISIENVRKFGYKKRNYVARMVN